MDPTKVLPIIALGSLCTSPAARRPSAGTRVTRAGALLIAAALVTLAVGIAVA
jgi:hypothetical protein